MIHVAEVLPDADEIAEAHRERLAERAADRLRQHPELRRAVALEPDGNGYLAGVAVPFDGGIATALLRVPDADPFALLEAFDAVCEGER